MGTSLANRSGPVTLGSVGFTGRALTSGAPGRVQVLDLLDSFLENQRSESVAGGQNM